MKNLLSAFVFLVFFSACSGPQAEDTSIHMEGTITNPAGDEVKISSDNFEHVFTLDSSAYFEGDFDIEPGYYTFQHGRERSTIYLDPAFDLKVGLDSEMFDESITFTGIGSTENNYLAKKYLVEEEMSSDMRAFYSMDESTFAKTNEANKNKVIDLLNNQQNLDADFLVKEKLNINYDYLGAAKNFESYHGYFTGNRDFKATSTYNKQFEDIDFENEEYFKTIPSYHDMVRNYFLGGSLDEALGKLENIKSTYIIEEMVEVLSGFISPGTEALKEKIDLMKTMTSDDEVKTNLDQQYEQMKALAKGNPSPGFNFENIVGKQVDLKDLMGKNVYIDVWATWCGPCKAEIPHLKELEKSYHGKNVEFVSISVDVPKDKQKWKDMVADKELKGVQLITDNGWDTGFIESYLIKGIPRFIVLDDNGQIVSADAPRPSSGKEIRDMLDGLEI
ncbi:MAG: TlpA family protein disulfide reductase [Bacteroidia bacterium]|nr:TlpA family protein disulfide reductase [Bacteroidia bacterium]